MLKNAYSNQPVILFATPVPTPATPRYCPFQALSSRARDHPGSRERGQTRLRQIQQEDPK